MKNSIVEEYEAARADLERRTPKSWYAIWIRIDAVDVDRFLGPFATAAWKEHVQTQVALGREFEKMNYESFAMPYDPVYVSVSLSRRIRHEPGEERDVTIDCPAHTYLRDTTKRALRMAARGIFARYLRNYRAALRRFELAKAAILAEVGP